MHLARRSRRKSTDKSERGPCHIARFAWRFVDLPLPSDEPIGDRTLPYGKSHSKSASPRSATETGSVESKQQEYHANRPIATNWARTRTGMVDQWDQCDQQLITDSLFLITSQPMSNNRR